MMKNPNQGFFFFWKGAGGHGCVERGQGGGTGQEQGWARELEQ